MKIVKHSKMVKHVEKIVIPTHIWLENLQIVGRNFGNRIKIKTGEALLINELKLSLNKKDKSFPLKLFN